MSDNERAGAGLYLCWLPAIVGTLVWHNEKILADLRYDEVASKALAVTETSVHQASNLNAQYTAPSEKILLSISI